jgi:hypothetical protein
MVRDLTKLIIKQAKELGKYREREEREEHEQIFVCCGLLFWITIIVLFIICSSNQRSDRFWKQF